MEKLKIVIILLGLIWFSGCGYIKQTNIESKDIAFSEEETTSIQSDYENYIGTWSEEGKSHESIIYEGGTEFSVEITSDNELNGYLYSQQEISGRFAEIDIICRIEDGECYYPFSDDGWGNSGILYIQFETYVILISVQDFIYVLSIPNPLVVFPCGSISIKSTFWPASAKHADKFIAVVVLPTPPFWLAIAIILPIFNLFPLNS